MKKIIIAALILISTTALFAQPDNYRQDLDYLFGALDKTKANTGYLGPYGIDAVDKDDFNGILADSNTVNSLDLFRFIYADIFTAKFNPTAPDLPTIEAINQAIQAENPNTLAIFYAAFNEFKEDAIQQGLISYINGRLYDNMQPMKPIEPSKFSITPYINKKIFAVSPIAQYYKNTVTLRFNPALFYNNANLSIQNLWINFGNGYTLVPANTNASYTYTDSTGYHRIAIKVQLSNDEIVETYTAVMVEVINGSETYTPADLANPDFTIPASGTQSGCKVYIRRSVNTPTGQLLRPFIVVEGLDMHDGAPAIAQTNYNVNNLIAEWNGIVFNSQTINFNFDNIGHYDLVFVDWNDGVDDIPRNALTLEQVINTINTMKTGTEQNVVMGISMGGLVARYTLASMTKRSLNTQTRLLITHDSPHRGAYVPLAFQHLVTGLQNRTILGIRLGAIGHFIDQGVELLNKPGAQQELKMVVTNQDGAVAENTFLENIYRPMITFVPADPQPQYQFIATSQGSQCGIGTIPIGSSLANGEVTASVGGLYFVLTAGIVSRLKLKVSLAANGLTADGNQHEILYFRWRRESSLFWGVVNTSKTFIELHRNEPTNFSNPIPWESVPGAVENLRFTNQQTFEDNWSVFSLGFLGYDYRFNIGQQFSFLPVISALDVVNPNNFNRINIFNFQATVNTPPNTFIPQRIIAQERFFGISGFEFNQPHTDFTFRNGRWIFNEMQNITQPIDCDDQCPVDPVSLSIVGNNIICNSEQYSISNLPAGATVTWSIPGSAGPVLQLSPNVPGPNQLTITNQRWYTVTTTLTAVISNLICGTPDQVRTMTIANDNSTSGVAPYPYYQEACVFYNVSHPSESGTAYSNSGPTFVHQGCMVYVDLGTIPGTVTLAPGSGQPMFWSVGTTSYYQNTLYFQLPLGSGGVPFVFNITVNGACFNKSLLFFSYSNNGRYFFTAIPNPVKNILTVTAKENKDLLLQTKNESTKNNLQFIMNIYDVNTNTLQMTKSSNKGSLQYQINTSRLKTGYYVLQIIEGDQTQSIKFFKSN